jgi:catalase
MTQNDQEQSLSLRALQAFDNLGGVHAGHRPTHAKGILLTGRFTPSAQAASLTKAPHVQRESTPVTLRLSDFGGIPSIPDNDPNASPRGIAIRFHLGEHVHTDIIAHSVDGFPVRTAEEFIEFLQAIGAGPSAIEAFLGSHPAALEFIQAPKPFPSSFAHESFFAVNAYRFTNSEGVARYGRYRVQPAAGSDYLTPETAAQMGPNYLFEEIAEKLAKQPVTFKIVVQLATAEDVVDDSTVHWPDSRPVIEFGTVTLEAIAAANDAEQRHIIFDPIPRVEGIEPSGDPLLEPRADLYLLSGRRRRKAIPE